MDRHINRFAIFLFLGDALLTPLGLLLASQLRAALPFGKPLGPEGHILPIPIYLLAIACWSGSLLISGAYKIERSPHFITRITHLASAAGTATILLAGFLYMTYREVSRLQFLYSFLINLGLLLLFRGLVFVYLQPQTDSPLLTPSRVIIIGARDLAREIARKIQNNPMWGYRLVGYLDDAPDIQRQVFEGIPVLGRYENLLKVIEDHSVNEVWSTLPPRAYDQLHTLVAKLEKIPVRIKVIPDYFSLALVQASVEMLGGFPIIGLREPLIRGLPRLAKRVFDLMFCILLLILAAPFMVAIAIAIRVDSPGPIIFRQTRVGENARPFKMLKFRTMTKDAEAQIDQVMRETGEPDLLHKRKDDPRITRVGGFLRRFSLDELPQLFNVLRGEMSLVGPRPELPWLVERYKPWQRKRFAVPQGITGWWQVNGRSEKPMHLNTDEDLYYIYNYSLWLDMVILLRTPFVVLRGEGAF